MTTQEELAAALFAFWNAPKGVTVPAKVYEQAYAALARHNTAAA